MSNPLNLIKAHPRGLSVLFFTEFWERFSYYGMRALLILFMVDAVETGGFGFTTEKAASIYGWYTALVYATAIPGGWLADRYLGLRHSVFLGGVLIAAGHLCLAISHPVLFFMGLALIVAGTGCLKPNVSALVGSLYEANDARRDAGFSIFYMGINLGAMIAPLICGWLGQQYNWHYGFGAAAVGMIAGLVQYQLGAKHLPAEAKGIHTSPGVVVGILLALIGVSFFVLYEAGLGKNLAGNAVSAILLLVTLIWFGKNFVESAPHERGKIGAIAVLFLFSALFWGAFEQAGSSLNLFAQRFTDTRIGSLSFPASWFQSVNSLFIIGLSPVFAWVWMALKEREPSSPTKFTFGLTFVGLGFLVMAFAALGTNEGMDKVGPGWLVLCYLLHTIGELCLSPVGLSTVTKLAPARMVGGMMGVWFLSISLGNKIGGLVAGQFEKFPLPELFGMVFATTALSAVFLVFLIRPIKRLMGDVR